MSSCQTVEAGASLAAGASPESDKACSSPDSVGNSHNFGYGVEGCSNLRLVGDYNSHVVAELSLSFSLSCCCWDST